MMNVSGLNGKQYMIESKPFKSGGEGEVYRVINQKDRIVKIYHKSSLSKQLEEKLRMMVDNPPNKKILSQIAWPIDVVYDRSGFFCGFVMPFIQASSGLGEVYVYPPNINISLKEKIIIAQNICAVINEVHGSGYIFGDFNPRNIGVDVKTGDVAFFDTDSYHIVIDKRSQQAYRCNVCAPGYAAPELLEACEKHIARNPSDRKEAYAKTPLDTFTKETDNFALAIHIFKLLMNGFTPFGGIKHSESASVASPGLGDKAVRRDSYCFKPGNKHQSVAVPSLNTLPKEISTLFTSAFIGGKKDPARRPSAKEWYNALEVYLKDLKQCSQNANHQYYSNVSYCPWCEADKRFSNAINKQYLRRPVANPAVANQYYLNNAPIAPTGINTVQNTQTNYAQNPVYTGKTYQGWYEDVFLNGFVFWLITTIIAVGFSLLAYYFISPKIFEVGYDGDLFSKWVNKVCVFAPKAILVAGIIGPWIYQVKIGGEPRGGEEYIFSGLISIGSMIAMGLIMVAAMIVIPVIIAGIILVALTGG